LLAAVGTGYKTTAQTAALVTQLAAASTVVDTGTDAAGAAAAGGVVKKTGADYCEPADGRKPVDRWRAYVFVGAAGTGAGVGAGTGGEAEATLHLHRQSCYRLGRLAGANDIVLEDPTGSCSAYHAVVQYRVRPVTDADGRVRPVVKPYLMDVGSRNGTRLGGVPVEPFKFYELLPGDSVVFGAMEKEYVFMKVA
jgi:hypothetical protein